MTTPANSPKKKPSKTWTATKIPQLYRHQSGVLYARLNVGGKRTWRSLKTELQSVAKAELEKLLNSEAIRVEIVGKVPAKLRLTMGELKAIRLKQIANNVALKDSTRHYWSQIAASLTKSWEGFDDLQARNVTPLMCEEWAGNLVETISPHRYNNHLLFLRKLMAIAIKQGARAADPTAEMERARLNSKDLASTLPTKEVFAKWIAEMRKAKGRSSQDCADFVEFLTYSGLRKGEACYVRWCDIDEKRGEIIVRGHPKHGTKNRHIRRVPIIDAMKNLLGRIRARRGQEEETALVVRVSKAQKAMDNAAERIAMKRITHHDLRHLFATICIESGVDIPTVSRWMGHSDGGALAMRVYGHLRNEHSLAAAKKVSFA